MTDLTAVAKQFVKSAQRRAAIKQEQITKANAPIKPLVKIKVV